MLKSYGMFLCFCVSVDFVCWVDVTAPSVRTQLMAFAIPVYLPLLLMVVCNAVVLVRLVRLLSRSDTFHYVTGNSSLDDTPSEHSHSSTGGMPYLCACADNLIESMGRLDDRSRAIVLRMILLPVIYLTVAFSSTAVSRLPNGKLVDILLNTALGLANVILWVGVDTPVVNAWKNALATPFC